MTLLFWVDIIGLSLSILIAGSLTILVVGVDPKNKVNRSFGYFTGSIFMWTGSALLLRISLWLDPVIQTGLFLPNTHLWLKIAAVSVALICILSLMFTVTYLDRRTRYTDFAIALGFLLIILLVARTFFTPMATISEVGLNANGLIFTEMSTSGLVVLLVLNLYILSSIILFLQERQRTEAKYLALCFLILLFALVSRTFTHAPFPFLSFSNALSALILAYAVSSKQIFNPLKARTIQLKEEIEERKKAEEDLIEAQQRYQALFNSKTNLVFVMDAEGNFIDANAPALELFGYTKEDIPDLNYLQLLHPDQNVEMIANEMIDLLETGAQTEPLEVKLKSKDGKTIYIQSGGTIISGKEEIIGVAQDITDKKITEEAKQKLEKQLLQAQKMEAIGTLAGGIAHDFNNSLQGILGFIQILLLDKQEDTPTISKYRKIEAAALRASELTQQLLTFSRRVESKLRPVNLNQEAQQVEKLLRRTIPKMIDIELHLEKDLYIINADPAQIEQVMMNLGINARDAMPQGGKLMIETENVVLDEVYCRTHLEAVPGEYVMLSVSDNGTGIDKNTSEYIFDPFFTTKDPSKGTGLGLAMVYGIIQNHRGHISCYSEPGEGTIFKIYFPALKDNYIRHPEQQEKVEEIRRGTETILLVDDENPIRELAKEILSSFGYSVFAAADGESALEIYREKQKHISLIILDLIMPGMGGKKCLEEILKIDPSQKVVIVSGYSVNGSTRDLLKMGAKGYIKKPYEMGPMLAVVREVLDQE
ncbi:MAG: response regulator [Deltaproteobacteria bacterium]|nr:response regulator [Deltaproteobacteria bacterium]MBW1846481.1 response regulator [Deltaproteobacteria bacterium]